MMTVGVAPFLLALGGRNVISTNMALRGSKKGDTCRALGAICKNDQIDHQTIWLISLIESSWWISFRQQPVQREISALVRVAN